MKKQPVDQKHTKDEAWYEPLNDMTVPEDTYGRPEVGDAMAPQQKQPDSQRRSVKLVIGIAVGVCVLLCAVAFILVRSQKAQAPSSNDASVSPTPLVQSQNDQPRFTIQSGAAFDSSEPVYVRNYVRETGASAATQELQRFKFSSGAWETVVDYKDIAATLIGSTKTDDGWLVYISAIIDKKLELYVVVNGTSIKRLAELSDSDMLYAGAILPDKSGITVLEYSQADGQAAPWRLVNYYADGSDVAVLAQATGVDATWDGYTNSILPMTWSKDGKTLFLTGEANLAREGTDGDLVAYIADTKKFELVYANPFAANVTVPNGKLYPNEGYVMMVHSNDPDMGGNMEYQKQIDYKTKLALLNTRTKETKILYDDTGEAQTDHYTVLGKDSENTTWFVSVHSVLRNGENYTRKFLELREYTQDGTYTLIDVPHKENISSIDYADTDALVYTAISEDNQKAQYGIYNKKEFQVKD